MFFRKRSPRERVVTPNFVNDAMLNFVVKSCFSMICQIGRIFLNSS
jgi:hypothetical protein